MTQDFDFLFCFLGRQALSGKDEGGCPTQVQGSQGFQEVLARHDACAVRGGRIVDDLDPQLIGDTTVGGCCSLKFAQLSECIVGQDLAPDGLKIGEALPIVRHHPLQIDVDRFDPDFVGKSKEWNRLRSLLSGPEAFMLLH